MSVGITWSEIFTRLALTAFAGLLIGYNRGQHGRPAGMCTTLLVCMTACLSMIMGNLILGSRGKSPDGFVSMDVMRLPLGVLSGMGFIGAGTIMRRGSLVIGVTTAATLWFVTLLGLCFGSGHAGLGLVALALGCLALWGVKALEQFMQQDMRGTLTILIAGDGPPDAELREMLADSKCSIISWGITHERARNRREVCCELQWRRPAKNTSPPAVVGRLAGDSRVETVEWQPQGLSVEMSPQGFGASA